MHSLISVAREREDILGKNFSDKCYEIFDKYHPIEIDPNVKMEEKVKSMEKWWVETFDLLIDSRFSKKHCKEIAFSDKVEFREEAIKFFHKNKDIPFIIISASGIGLYPIKYFFEKNEVLYDNIKVISNDFVWDKKDVAIDYKTPIIHSFNKSETVLKEYKEVYKKIENRKNIILLGDSLGDHHMADGFDYDNIINIGFLNHNEEKLLEEYKKRYDIVITGDGDFRVISEILESIK